MRALSLFYHARAPKQSVQAPALLILLHGVGCDENFWADSLPQLDERFLILSVRAPERYANGGYCWFPVKFANGKFIFDAAQAQASWRALTEFATAAAAAYNIAPKQSYLLGFSQGATVALCAMLTAPEKLGGVIALNGQVMAQVKPHAADAKRLRNFPVLYGYGALDPIVPLSSARRARAFLTARDVALEMREFQSGHELTAETWRVTTHWLAARLAGTRII